MTILRLRAVHLSFAGLFAVAVLHAESTATIKADRTNLRAKPAFDGEVLATLQKGDTVTVLGQVPGTGTDGKPRDWTKVALPKRAQVWVYAPLVDEKTKVVKGKSLNLRAGPGKNYSELGELKQGASVTIIREMEGWLQIEPPTDTFAFVAASLIELPPASSTGVLAKKTGQVGLPENNSTPVAATESKPLPAQAQPVATETVKQPAPEPVPEPAKPVVTEPVPAPAPVPVVVTPIYSNPTPTIAPVPETNSPLSLSTPKAPRKFLRYQPPARSVPTDKDFVPAIENAEAKPREVLREGKVGRAWNVQAPGHLELVSLRDEGTLDFLYCDNPEIDLTKFRNQRVIVTGEEWRDSRWKTPLLKVKSIQSAE